MACHEWLRNASRRWCMKAPFIWLPSFPMTPFTSIPDVAVSRELPHSLAAVIVAVPTFWVWAESASGRGRGPEPWVITVMLSPWGESPWAVWRQHSASMYLFTERLLETKWLQGTVDVTFMAPGLWQSSCLRRGRNKQASLDLCSKITSQGGLPWPHHLMLQPCHS